MLDFSFATCLLLVYACTVMAMLLGVNPLCMTLAKRAAFFAGLSFILLENVIMMLRLGAAGYGQFYPLLAQLPMFLLFYCVSGKGLAKCFFVLLTAIFLAYPYTLFSTITYKLCPSFWGRSLSSLIIVSVLVSVIHWWLKNDFNYIIEYFTAEDTLKFCIIPVLYNLTSYSFNQYAITTQISTTKLLLFLSTLSAYFLTLDVFHRTREVQCMQNEQALLVAGIAAAEEQISTLRQTQEQTTVYRHDMRHHFALLSGYLAADDVAAARSYISQVQTDIDAVTPVRYCLNNTINLILSYFVAKAKQQNIILQVEANLPQAIPIPETELCTVFSNGLENALAAAAKIPQEKRVVHFHCGCYKSNLLLCIENPYVGEVEMKNGRPQTKGKGHGFGTKSMELIAQKYNGSCSFTTQDNMFTLKIVFLMPEQKG